MVGHVLVHSDIPGDQGVGDEELGGGEEEGPRTRARASNMRPRFTRDNMGTYLQRRSNWMGRAMRFNEYLITKQPEFYRKFTQFWSMTTRKKMLKELLLELEHDQVDIPL